MKSLILKDFYNISHNAKSMVFILLIFAIAFLPSSGIQSYIITCTLLCSMMTVTTFSFDEHCNWPLYAMVMPVSKKDVVAGKYMVLLAFSLTGAVFGLVVGLAGSRIAQHFSMIPKETALIPVPLSILTALSVSVISGSLSIALAFKFGAEKGRILILASIFIPIGICYIAYQALIALGIVITDDFITIFLYSSPILALFWGYIMYRISCAVFVRKELQ